MDGDDLGELKRERASEGERRLFFRLSFFRWFFFTLRSFLPPLFFAGPRSPSPPLFLPLPQNQLNNL